MSGAAKSNVLMFLAAMCAVGAVWLAISAFGTGSPLYAVIAALLTVATVVAFRAYRKVLRELDEQERPSR
jgi:membrane protein implicated in regulation of membrane protease activity